MDTLLAFLVAFAVTFYFVRNYVRGMALAKSPAGGSAAAPAAAGPTSPCPRCSKPTPLSSAFCASCGAPLELWKVHRASVAEKKADSGEPAPLRPVINASLCIGCGTCIDVCPRPGALSLVDGKAILSGPDICTGEANCKDACPTSGIAMAAGDVLQTLRAPLVNENFETNVSGVYIVGELGGMGLIKTAINEGRLAIDYIQKRLKEAGDAQQSASEDDPADVIIVGSGPAGLSAALTAQQLGLRYLAFDQAEVASTIRQYPRHKFLMAEPVQMPLYGSLYIADGTKESLVSVWENIINNTGVEVRTNERVEGVSRVGDLLEVQTVGGAYRGKQVVLAMGKRGVPRRIGAPGEDLGKVSYRLIEAESYEGRDILVVGGGDSAIEAALALSRDKRNRVTLSYRKDEFSRLKERNRERLNEAEKEERIDVLRSSNVREIRPESVKLALKSGEKEIPNEFVFVMIGGESPEGFLRKTGIEIVEKAVAA